jgi:hypothetical protein
MHVPSMDRTMEMSPMPPTLTTDQWRDDLDDLLIALRTRHRHPFHTISEDALTRQARALHDRIPSLDAHEIIIAFARIVAMIGDGHTVLKLDRIPWFRRYPVEFYRYSNGLCVRAIARDHETSLGARLLSIDGMPADDAMAAMRPFVSRDNEMGIIAAAPRYLSIPEVVHAGRVVCDMTTMHIEVERLDGTITTLALAPVAETSLPLVAISDNASGPAPLSLERPEDNWFRYLREHRVMFLAFNRVADGADESAATLFDRLFAAIEEQAADRLVIDLRRNGGGNNLLNQPLIHHLVRCDPINHWGGLFALIGRVTFSAAMNLAVDLERHTKVIFVGEPTGSSPNHYGETTMVVLPNSGIELSISSLLWQTSLPFDDRPWIAPDLPARLSSSQEAMKVDPGLDAALACDPASIPEHEYPDRVFAQLLPSRSHNTAGTFR